MNLKDKKWFKKFILSIIILALLFSVFLTNLKNYYKNYIYNNKKLWLIKVNNHIIEKNQVQRIFEYKIFLLNNKSITHTYDLLKNKIYIKKLYKNIIYNLINKCLIKEYIKNNDIKNNYKNIKNLIMEMDFFKKNNKFNSIIYYNFLKTNNLNENTYLKIISNKITEKFFFKDLINLNNLFKKEKIFLKNFNQEKILCKKYTINFKKITAQQKYTNEEIKNFYNTHKKLFINEKKFKIKFFKITPFLKSNQKIKKLDILEEFQNNQNKYSILKEKQISYIKFNTKIEAIKKLKKIKNQKKLKFNTKKIIIDNYNYIKNFNLNWITKKEFIKIIKKINLKKDNQISKIIKFKNQFIIFKIDKIKKYKNKNIYQIKNRIKEKLINKIKKKNYQKLIQKINLLSINNIQYFDLLKKIINKKSIKTGWITNKTIPKEINLKKIKYFLKNYKNYINEKKIKNINYRFCNSNQNIFIQIINFKKNTIKPISKVEKKIIKLIQTKKSKIQIFNQIKKIETDLNQKSYKNIYQKNIFFNKKKYFITNKNKYSQMLMKKFNTDYIYHQPIYITLTNHKNKWVILKLYKKYYIKLTPHEINKIYKKYKTKNHKILIKLTLEFLRSKARIQFNKDKY